MGGRGSIGGVISSAGSVTSLKSKMDSLGKRMQELAPTSYESDAKRSEYLKVLKKYQSTREKYNQKLNVQAAKKQKLSATAVKTKLNGYGEATSREITSTTYDNWLKRKTREVSRFVGNH